MLTFHTAQAGPRRAGHETARETAYPTAYVPPLPPDRFGARPRPWADWLHPSRRLEHAPGDLRALKRTGSPTRLETNGSSGGRRV